VKAVHRGRHGEAWSVVVLIATTNAGCAKILGVDGYVVGSPEVTTVCPDPMTAPSGKDCVKLGPECASPGFVADPAGGCRAVLPSAECLSSDASPMGAYPSVVDCGFLSNNCDSDPPRNLSTLGASFYYVDPAAAPGGDGTPERPFATINDALKAPTRRDVLLLHSGTYHENVDLTYPVTLRGSCPTVPTPTRIIGTSPSVPTIHIGKGADGSSVSLLEVSGDPAGTAVAIEHDPGAVKAGVGSHLSSLWIHDVRQGVTIDDSGEGAPLKVTQVLLERIAEHALTIRGSSVVVNQITIRDVASPSLSPAVESAAITVHPSRHAPHQETTTTHWDPWNATRSQVSVTDSLIEHAPIGLLVEGSSAMLSTTVVRKTTTGVLSRWNPLGAIAGDVTIDHSLIEESAEVGVQVWNAHTTISQSTIRATGAECPTSGAPRPVGAYPGNAVRARFDHVPGAAADGGVTFDEASQALAIDHSLLDASKQAGLHVEGGATTVDHVLIRATATESCTGALGDGMMVYSHAGFPPAKVKISTTRIAGSAGSGIAAFGDELAPLSLDGVVLDGNAPGIARDSAQISIDGDPSCGSGASMSRCAPGSEPPTRSVSIATCSTKNELDCVSTCVEGFNARGTVPSGPVVLDLLREPRIAPAISDAKGCVAVGRLEAGREYAFGFFSDVFVPSQGPVMIPAGAPWAPTGTARIDLVPYQTLGGGPTLDKQKFGPDGLDLALGVNAAVYVCAGPPPPLDPNAPLPLPRVCPTGVQDWTPTLVNPPPGTLGPYVTTEGFVPIGPRQAGTPVGGLWYYFNVAPGDYELRLSPDGKSGHCTSMSPPVVTGVPYDSAASSSFTDLRLRVEAGYATAAGYFYCTP
jgi:hypothetical protein